MKKLAIVGAHPRTRGLAPFDDPEYDIWGFNEALSSPKTREWFKRADAIFQMHIPAIWKNPKNSNDPEHLKWLMSGETPNVYMLEKYPEVPKAIKYPFDEIRETLLTSMHVDSDVARKDFYTSTIAFSTALALYLGYEHIEWFGIELEVDAEYRYQRDSACFWAGVCVGRGVDFTVHSQIFDTPIYGLESFITIDKQIFLDRYNDRQEATKKQIEVYNEAKVKVLDMYSKFKNNDSLREELREIVQKQATEAQKFGLLDGANQEDQRFYTKANVMENASGNYVFSKHEFERDRNAILKKREETMNQWQGAAARCQEIQDQIEPVFDSGRRKLVAELKTAIDVYVKLSGIVGYYTGGSEEDMELRKYMDKSDDKTS